MYEEGYLDAKAVLEMGEGVMARVYTGHANAIKFEGYESDFKTYLHEYKVNNGLI
jgi:hypothetical protein